MRTIRLYPVREYDDKPRWRYRTQVLGTVLIWAHRANAVRVEYTAGRHEPFQYFDGNGNMVQSEFVQPPEELRAQLTRTLFLDTIDGHPFLRPFRRILRRCCGLYNVAKLRVPDIDHQTESEWWMIIGVDSTVFERTDTLPYPPLEHASP